MTRICNHPGCPQHVEHGNRCPAHRAPDKRGSRGYSTTAWQTARTTYLHQHPECEYGRRSSLLYDVQIICGAIATDVHHIDGLGPRGPRGTDPANLMALCRHHHSSITGREHAPGSRAIRGVA